MTEGSVAAEPGPEGPAPGQPPIGQPSSTSPPAGWAPPPAAAEVPGAPGFVFADVPARLVAYLVDSTIVAIPAWLIAAALGFGETSVSATSTVVWVSGPTLSVAFALVGLVYFVFSWTGGRRATIGQRIFDIQVGNAFDGRPLGLDQAVRRWLGYGSFLGLLSIVPALGGLASLVELVWVLVLLVTTAQSPTRQGLHDRLARSAVVRPSSRSSSTPAVACLIILIVLGVLYMVVALIVMTRFAAEFSGTFPMTALV